MARLSVRTKGGKISGGPITWLLVGCFYLAYWSILAAGMVIVWVARELVKARRRHVAAASTQVAATPAGPVDVIPAPIEDAKPW